MTVRFKVEQGGIVGRLYRAPEDEVCDFCGLHDLDLMAYPAGDFRISDDPIPPIDAVADDGGRVAVTGPVTSHGYWAACPRCHALIQAGARSALLSRSVSIYAASTRLPPAALRDGIKEAHDRFFDHRQGEPERRLKPKGTA